MAKATTDQPKTYESIITLKINLANADASSQEEADAQANARLLEYLRAKSMNVQKLTKDGGVMVDANEQPILHDKATLAEMLGEVQTEEIFNVVASIRADHAAREARKETMARETRQK